MIDWIVAEWIAARVAGLGEPRRLNFDLAAMTADAERRVVAYTGLTPLMPIPAPEWVSRREWIAANLSSMQALMDPVLERANSGLGKVGNATQLTLGFVASGEVGTLVGYMAQRVLGQYELLLLKDTSERPARLLFVEPNLAKSVVTFEANEQEFLTWVTLHEVTHAVQFGGVPWLQPHLAGMVEELMASAELRLDAKRKWKLPAKAELARVGSALRRGDLIAIVTSEAERATIDRVQAVMAVIEGHAEHVMDAVAPELIPSLPALRAALDKRRKTQSALSRIVGRLLGLEMKMKQYERGKIFCDAVVDAAGPAALSYVFSAPEALPTLAEIENPAGWLARTGQTASA